MKYICTVELGDCYKDSHGAMHYESEGIADTIEADSHLAAALIFRKRCGHAPSDVTTKRTATSDWIGQRPETKNYCDCERCGKFLGDVEDIVCPDEGATPVGVRGKGGLYCNACWEKVKAEANR